MRGKKPRPGRLAPPRARRPGCDVPRAREGIAPPGVCSDHAPELLKAGRIAVTRIKTGHEGDDRNILVIQASLRTPLEPNDSPRTMGRDSPRTTPTARRLSRMTSERVTPRTIAAASSAALSSSVARNLTV